MQVRLSLRLTMYPSGQAQVPPSGDAWQRCWQLREVHRQIPEQRTQTGETAGQPLASTNECSAFASALTAVAAGRGVALVLSVGAVRRPVTQVVHGDAQAGGGTGPLARVTLPLHVVCRQKGS